MGEWGGIYRVLVGESNGRGSLVRPRCKWEHNIKMDLEEVRHILDRSGSG